MKRLGMFLMFMLSMVMANYRAVAQEITITLNPGWTWISYPRADTLDVTTALQAIPPSQGDIIKSQNGGASVFNNGFWIGSLRQLIPGKGLMYRSMKTEEASFVFGAPNPLWATVTTTDVTNIAQTSAKVSGNVIDEGGAVVTERGVCWSSDHHHPTTDDNHISNGSGTGSYTVTMTGLSNNKTYHVRTYATNEHGTNYGEEVTFTTLIYGVIGGKFTINDEGDQIYFSRSNLQCIPNYGSWSFDVHQYDYIGSDNSHISSSYIHPIDLFGWGTSYQIHGAVCYQPWSTSTNGADYYAYGNVQYNLYDQTGKADWGYNSISSGGNQQNQWRTLTKSEWLYVVFNRTTSSGIRYAKAKVNGVNGLILLPDDWNPTNYPLNYTNSTQASFSSNTLTSSQWLTYETHGAIFLPAAGIRNGTSVSSVNGEGYYWSSSHLDTNNNASVFSFSSNSVMTTNLNRSRGAAVRLVYPAHPVQYE